jgi:predicted SprT family Zn-dependent metalloprotease
LARPAYVYLSEGPLPADDGDVLVIEIDGKAVPTATEQELARRRRPRTRHEQSCKCQRHRGRARRERRGRKKRRKKGDQSKNGRSATLVVMYT